MSIQQGLISPPLSGRTYKADPPHPSDVCKGLRAADMFGCTKTSSSRNTEPTHFEHRPHAIHSPVKKHKDDLSDADRAARPLTPPMSKDVRHDDRLCEREDQAVRHRTSSEGDDFNAASSSSSSEAIVAASTANAGLLQAIHTEPRFDTLNRGVDFKSDDEHNPFLDRRPPATTSKMAASNTEHPHHSHPYFDEFDSDQDAEGSVHGDDSVHDLGGDATPRASSSSATTPPPARINRTAYRPARPFSTHARVDNEPVTSVMPIRDTPKNPFLQGGPADNGFQGPNAHLAHRRAKQIPGKERGKIVYVFRGQRVTYADPEYDSDDDDDSDLDERSKTYAVNAHHNSERPPRLQPKLLFPPAASSSSNASRSTHTNTNTARSNAQLQPRPAFKGRDSDLPRAEFEDDVGGASCHVRSGAARGNGGGGGLFAAQIAAQRKQAVHAARTAAMHSSQVRNFERYNEGEQRYAGEAAANGGQHGRYETAARSGSVGLQDRKRHDTYGVHGSRDGISGGKQAADESRQAARNALLARLDQTDWSDDDNDEDDDRHRSSHSRRRAYPGSEETSDEEEHPSEGHEIARWQSQQKRRSDELQRGHAEEVDMTGRPMKRLRASYAY